MFKCSTFFVIIEAIYVYLLFIEIELIAHTNK